MYEWKCSYCGRILMKEYHRKQEILYFCNQDCSKNYRNLIGKKDKLAMKIKQLLDNGNVILYIDTDSIMYIDDKLNLIEEDIDKL